jgi:putative hydrolase
VDPFPPGDDEPEPDPLAGIPVFGDLSRLFAQQGAPDAWQAARQFALMVATDGRDEPNVDPLERIRIEQLARVAELHVAATTGLVVPAGAAGAVEPVTRAVWAQRTLDAHRRYIQLLGDSLGQPPAAPDEPDPDDPMGFMAPLLRMAAPMMLGLSAGSMVGHLARQSFGQYDLPLPRPAGAGVLLVPANIDAFVEAWDLPPDDLRLWLCLHELTFHTVLAVPHVRRRLDDLLVRYLSGFDPAAGDLGSRLEELDPRTLGDPGALPAAFSDPEVLLGAIRSPAQEAMLPELEALVAVLVGYVDHVLDRAGEAILPNHQMLAEAVRRRRVESGDAGRLVERLFGLELSARQVDRGRAFVAGVLERAGEDGLARLWVDDDALPTPPEVDAPGLWLARIDLPT